MVRPFILFTGLAMMVMLAMLLPLSARSQPGQPGSPAGVVGVTQCGVQMVNGTPVLTLDGRRTPPLIFFFNNEAAVGAKAQNWEPQVKMAGEAGVHIYSMGLNPPPLGSGVEPSTASLKAALDPFIAADPQALFIPRINVTAWGPWLAAHPAEQMLYADGTRGYEAIASEIWKSEMHAHLRHYLRFIEDSPYGRRMIGYHIAGQNSGEWFPEGYREKGPDISPANTAGFRAWLKIRYGTDEALKKAWGNGNVSLTSATVPAATVAAGEPGRFPIHNIGQGTRFDAFYRLPEERNWVDYSQYTSELTATCLIDFAKLVKAETQGRKLTVFFYGYILDLPASINGHNDLMRLLDCPEVDLLASPTPYGERLRGESTGFMTTVDSVAAHGKLWIIENDMRTHLWTREHQPPEIANDPQFIAEQSFLARPRDAGETVEILKRDFSAMLAHRCGTWWMDLGAFGAFKEPAIWQMIGQARTRYEALYANPAPYQPEVALIVDEQARNYEKSDWDLGAQVFTNLRHQLGLTGASYGIYLLDDFIAGRVPPCKAYVFANAFKLNDKQVAAMRDRLEREGSTAIWLYAPGWIGEAGADLEQSRRLTGLNLVQQDGLLGSHAVVDGAGAAYAWGVQTRGMDGPKTFDLSPRLVVRDEQAQVMSRYLADGEVSTALKREGRATHIFLGDINVTAQLLHGLLREAKVHLWTDAGLAVHTDGTFLSVHAAETGVYPIYLPAGVSLEIADGPSMGHDPSMGKDKGMLFVPFGRAQTRLFQIRQAQP